MNSHTMLRRQIVGYNNNVLPVLATMEANATSDNIVSVAAIIEFVDWSLVLEEQRQADLKLFFISKTFHLNLHKLCHFTQYRANIV